MQFLCANTNNKNADNTSLHITFSKSCDVCDDECQTLGKLEAHNNPQLVEVGPEEAKSCQLFTVQEAVQMCGQPHGPQQMVPRDLHGRDERTWHASMPATPYVKPGDNVMVSMPDLDRAKIDARSLHAVIVEEYSNDQL